MNIGDKVRVTKGEYKGLVGTIGNIMGEKVRIDNSRVDVFLWYDESELEPISNHMNFVSGTADNTNQRTASGVDPYTAECGDPVIKYWYDRGYHDGHDKGYKTGMQAVITNIKRFLKEITP